MLSIIIPTFNEEKNVVLIHKEISNLKLDIDYEIFFIDDGSIDNTFQEIKKLNISDKKVKCLSFSKNFGHQQALSAGIEKCKDNNILMMDCDLQHPTNLITTMIEKMNQGYDIVQMSKLNQGKRNLINKFCSYLFYNIFRLISGLNISNNTSDFRLISSKVAKELLKFKDREKFYRGMTQWLGFNTIEIKYEIGNRLYGKSKYGFKELFKLASFGIFEFSKLPLKLSFYFGLFFIFLSFIYLLLSIFNFFNDSVTVMINLFDLLSICLFIIGFQLIFMGLIGIYINRIMDHLRDRPQYIIDNEIN